MENGELSEDLSKVLKKIKAIMRANDNSTTKFYLPIWESILSCEAIEMQMKITEQWEARKEQIRAFIRDSKYKCDEWSETESAWLDEIETLCTPANYLHGYDLCRFKGLDVNHKSDRNVVSHLISNSAVERKLNRTRYGQHLWLSLRFVDVIFTLFEKIEKTNNEDNQIPRRKSSLFKKCFPSFPSKHDKDPNSEVWHNERLLCNFSFFPPLVNMRDKSVYEIFRTIIDTNDPFAGAIASAINLDDTAANVTPLMLMKKNSCIEAIELASIQYVAWTAQGYYKALQNGYSVNLNDLPIPEIPYLKKYFSASKFNPLSAHKVCVLFALSCVPLTLPQESWKDLLEAFELFLASKKVNPFNPVDLLDHSMGDIYESERKALESKINVISLIKKFDCEELIDKHFAKRNGIDDRTIINLRNLCEQFLKSEGDFSCPQTKGSYLKVRIAENLGLSTQKFYGDLTKLNLTPSHFQTFHKDDKSNLISSEG